MLFDEFLEIFLYLVTRLISFDCNSLLDKSMMIWNLFCSKDIKSTSIKAPRWSDGDTSLNVAML